MNFPDIIEFKSCKSVVELCEESVEWKFVKKGNKRVREKIKSEKATYRYTRVADDRSNKLGTIVELHISHISNLLDFGLATVVLK
jgi:hypothetical protein